MTVSPDMDRAITGRQTLYTVQAGRGIAAVLVVFYHASSMFALPKYAGRMVWDGWGEIGKHGVDFFFVLSGFIICFAHMRDIGKPRRLAHYVWRRLTRIYPTYWFYLTVFLIFTVLGVGGGDIRLDTAQFITSFTLLRFSSEKPVLQVAWTLYHELMFYAIFSTLIVSRWAGIAILVFWTAVILLMHDLRGPTSPTFLSVFYDLFNLEFLFGVAVALIWKRFKLTWGIGMTAVGVALLIFTAVATHAGTLVEPVMPLCFALSSAVLLNGLLMMESGGLIGVPYWLRRIGDATFTIYLAHAMVLSILLRFGARKVGTGIFSELFPIMIALFAIVTGVLLFYAIERPLLDLLKQAPWERNRSKAQSDKGVETS